MILVTVGTHSQGFDRLVKAADELASEIDEEIIIQYGCSQYIPKHANGIQWCTYDQMEELTEQARIVVGHAGSGTIITTLLKDKPLILVPRLSKFDEHIDDHQLELANIFQTSGKALSISEVNLNTLRETLSTITNSKPYPIDNSGLVNAIEQLLSKWENRN
jgi:beta-1,4-N-acetylglucosaminyltransferase